MAPVRRTSTVWRARERPGDWGGVRDMQVTKVSLRPVAMNKVCAIASVVFDEQFVVHDLRVVNGDKGLFVAMPSRKLPNGEFRDICHPISAEARADIERSVLQQFDDDGGLEHFVEAGKAVAGQPHADAEA